MEKVRGRKKALQALVKHMEDSAWKPVADQPVFITHGDCIEDVEYVSDLIREKFGDVKITVNYVDPVIGAHSGLARLRCSSSLTSVRDDSPFPPAVARCSEKAVGLSAQSVRQRAAYAARYVLCATSFPPLT